MFTSKTVLSLFCVILAVLMLLASCGTGRKSVPVISESESENLGSSATDTSDTALDTTENGNETPEITDENQTENDDVIIEVQRPVAGAPAGDTSGPSPTVSPETKEPSVTVPDEEASTELIPDEDLGSENEENANDLPYADEMGVFVPYNVPMSIEDQMLVERIAARFNVHEELVFGVMWAESRYDRGAVGKNDRYLGVMQVSTSNLPILEKYLGVTDLMDFEQNVTAGCYFLGHYADLYEHNMNIMLLYYHGGYKYANPMIQEGILEDRYVREVFAEMDRIVEARKQTAAELGVKLKGWLYEY